MTYLRLFLIAVSIGVVAELLAFIFGLWRYRIRAVALLNILVFYGLIMGTLAASWRTLGTANTFLIAAAIGFAYEVANLGWLHWWSFGDEQMRSGGREAAAVVVLSLLWGVVPLAAYEVNVEWRRWGTPPATPIEQLRQRETQLLGKLEQLQVRTKQVEAKLEAVRKRRERLLQRQGGQLQLHPEPTP